MSLSCEAEYNQYTSTAYCAIMTRTVCTTDLNVLHVNMKRGWDTTTTMMLNGHVATEAEPILSHLFGAEFGLEILLETERLSSQLFSDWSVLCCCAASVSTCAYCACH